MLKSWEDKGVVSQVSNIWEAYTGSLLLNWSEKISFCSFIRKYVPVPYRTMPVPQSVNFT
jgi:hypothetical protein